MAKETCANRIREALKKSGLKQADVARLTGIPKSALSQYISGAFEPKQDRIELLARTFGVSEAWLMGYDVPQERERNDIPHGMEPPTVTEEYVTFPVIGDLAAGFEHIAAENWSGDTICIPESYLRGRPAGDYIVLNVCGDSMYPFYLDGDKVLVLRTPALEYSGQVALVRYDGEMATLKKVEYHPGDDCMRLIPANPLYQPREIVGADLDQCSILGIPKLILRET